MGVSCVGAIFVNVVRFLEIAFDHLGPVLIANVSLFELHSAMAKMPSLKQLLV